MTSNTQTQIFDRDHLPGRRLKVQTVHANRYSTDLGREMTIAREQMARRLAALIMEQPDFFKVHGDGPFIEQWADIIVLTTDELADYARSKFKDGLAHARGFMPFVVPNEERA